MANASKRSRGVKTLVDRSKDYSVNDAMALLKQAATAKFDETVEVAIRLGVDARKSDQNVRGSAVLPRGLGKTVRVAVFASGTRAEEAREAGADLVGMDDLLDQVKAGQIDFQICIAEPEAMSSVAKLGRILGPRGLMPNPKTGTVRTDMAEAVREAKAGKVDFRTERAGIVHCQIGKASFEPDALTENLSALLKELRRLQPPSAKGRYIQQVSLSTSMGPGVRLNVDDLARL